MNNRRKPGSIWGNALALVGMIFAIIGGVFVMIAVPMFLLIDKMRAVQTGNGDIVILPLIFSIVGGIFLVLGISFLVIARKQRDEKLRVREEGYYVMAKAVNISRNYHISVNGKNPFRLECQYQDPATGTIHIYQSDNMFFYPEFLLGREVRVFLDRNGGKAYYVDLDEVMPNVEVH